MEHQFVISDDSDLGKRERIKDISILLPKIRAEFYVRLYSFLKGEPEISYECYEFFIKDNLSGKKFSAGLTGFGPGYFAEEKSHEMTELVSRFHEFLFNEASDFKNCRIEIENDFGKSIFAFEDNKIVEIDIEE